MFPVIKTIEVKGRFKYLWLKYVKDVNLSVHCAKSLVGAYSTRISTGLIEGSKIHLDEYVSRYFYLCGVSLPYKWSNNFHLAFRFKKGNEIKVNRNGIDIIIQDAEEIPINIEAMEIVNHEKLSVKAYSTCRNWQFANQIYLKENA